jgi:hypothetical protein
MQMRTRIHVHFMYLVCVRLVGVKHVNLFLCPIMNHVLKALCSQGIHMSVKLGTDQT